MSGLGNFAKGVLKEVGPALISKYVSGAEVSTSAGTRLFEPLMHVDTFRDKVKLGEGEFEATMYTCQACGAAVSDLAKHADFHSRIGY